MELPKLIDEIYRDQNSTLEMTDYALEVATQAAIDQGRNPDTHPVVQKLARRSLELEAKAKRMEADERAAANLTRPALKQPKRELDPSVAHIIAVAREASGPIAHEPNADSRAAEGATVGIPVIVDTKTNIVVERADANDQQLSRSTV